MCGAVRRPGTGRCRMAGLEDMPIRGPPNDSDQCCVCLDAVPDVAFDECRHAICSRCAVNYSLPTCPLCMQLYGRLTRRSWDDELMPGMCS